MIYATGDCHGNFRRFQSECFPEQANMTKDDAVIIAGDFGGVWFGDNCGNKALGRLTAFPQDIQEKPSYRYGYLDSNTTTAYLMSNTSYCGSKQLWLKCSCIQISRKTIMYLTFAQIYVKIRKTN